MTWGAAAVAGAGYVASNWGSFEGGEPGGGGFTSGYDMLPTEKKQALDRLRGFLSEDPNDTTNLGRGRAVFAPNYEAISKGDIESRVGRIGGAYKEMFNPFLKDLQSGIDKDLSRSGLLTSTRSAALRGHTLGQLAVQSYLPQAELQNSLEEQNRQDVWNRRMQILGTALGSSTDYPSQVQFQQKEGNDWGRLIGMGLNAYGSAGGDFGIGGDATAANAELGRQGTFSRGGGGSSGSPRPRSGFMVQR